MPLCLSFADLQAYPVVDQANTLICSASPISHITQASWQGIAFSNLLAEVQTQPQVLYAHLYAADGYTTCVEIEYLKRALLVLEKDNQPLTPEQGYPARLIVPGLYGYKMPKHIQHILLSDEPLVGYWEQRGWPTAGHVKPAAIFKTPQDQATIAGNVTLQGIAYSGAARLQAVELSVDDGPWMPVPIYHGSSHQLANWSIEWQPPGPGVFRLQVRAQSPSGIEPGQPHAIVIQVRSS